MLAHFALLPLIPAPAPPLPTPSQPDCKSVLPLLPLLLPLVLPLVLLLRLK
jgi:hypothetical protein